MKSVIITMCLMALCSVDTATGCPIWRIGKMYVVDEHNNPVKAKVWKFSSSNDSFLMGKDYHYGKDTLPSDPYTFFSHGRYANYNNERNPRKKYLLIKAEGFADVIIKDINFSNEGRLKDLPVLYVRMYPKKYIRYGDLYTLMDVYVCEKNLEVTDSLEVDFDDYTEKIRGASMVAGVQRVATYIVKTYPNPVKDKLNIEINAEVTKPYKAILFDIQGKLISESQLSAQNSILNMEWETAGVYFIKVYSPEGTLLYAFKFVKT
jgi:hypothetical protein